MANALSNWQTLAFLFILCCMTSLTTPPTTPPSSPPSPPPPPPPPTTPPTMTPCDPTMDTFPLGGDLPSQPPSTSPPPQPPSSSSPPQTPLPPPPCDPTENTCPLSDDSPSQPPSASSPPHQTPLPLPPCDPTEDTCPLGGDSPSQPPSASPPPHRYLPIYLGDADGVYFRDVGLLDLSECNTYEAFGNLLHMHWESRVNVDRYLVNPHPDIAWPGYIVLFHAINPLDPDGYEELSDIFDLLLDTDFDGYFHMLNSITVCPNANDRTWVPLWHVPMFYPNWGVDEPFGTIDVTEDLDNFLSELNVHMDTYLEEMWDDGYEIVFQTLPNLEGVRFEIDIDMGWDEFVDLLDRILVVNIDE